MSYHMFHMFYLWYQFTGRVLITYQFTGRDMFLQKNKRGSHFGVLTEMWIFQTITLHRVTNSQKAQAKIRLALHFVERTNAIKLA